MTPIRGASNICASLFACWESGINVTAFPPRGGEVKFVSWKLLIEAFGPGPSPRKKTVKKGQDARREGGVLVLVLYRGDGTWRSQDQ